MRKTLLLLALATVSAFLLVACSDNGSNPIDPDPNEDLVPPTSPSNLMVSVQGNTVHLMWRENVEADLAGYRIYRLSDGVSAQRLDEVMFAGYYDRVESSQPMILEYTITAFDQSNNESAYSSTVEVLLGTIEPEGDGHHLQNPSH